MLKYTAISLFLCIRHQAAKLYLSNVAQTQTFFCFHTDFVAIHLAYVHTTNTNQTPSFFQKHIVHVVRYHDFCAHAGIYRYMYTV